LAGFQVTAIGRIWVTAIGRIWVTAEVQAVILGPPANPETRNLAALREREQIVRPDLISVCLNEFRAIGILTRIQEDLISCPVRHIGLALFIFEPSVNSKSGTYIRFSCTVFEPP
jgi:hypothetical protein